MRGAVVPRLISSRTRDSGVPCTAGPRHDYTGVVGPALLHSVSYAGLWGQAYLTIDDFIDKAADLGFEGVELTAKRPHLSLLDATDSVRERLRARLERRNLRAICLGAYTNFTADLDHGEIPMREIQVHHVVELARLARDLGGNLVRVFTGYEHTAAAYGPQWKMIVDSLRECAARAAGFGVTIGVQNHHDIAAGFETMHDLIQAVGLPNCRAMFDAWAPFLHGADLGEAARKMGPLTVHTTVANYQLRPRYVYEPAVVNYRPVRPLVQAVPIGDGAIDYEVFLTDMHRAGFRGGVAYEMCSPLLDGGSMETLDAYARKFLDFYLPLRARLGRAEAAASPSL